MIADHDLFFVAQTNAREELTTVMTLCPVPLLRNVLVLLIFLLSNVTQAADQSPLATAQAFIAALSERNADKALQLLAEDAVLEMPYPLASGENSYGTRRMWGDPLRHYVRGITERNTTIDFRNSLWRVADDGVLILEADGDMIRARDGARYQNRYIILFEVKSGKIALWREYFNPVIAARTFGIALESLPD